jgi:protease IV
LGDPDRRAHDAPARPPAFPADTTRPRPRPVPAGDRHRSTTCSRRLRAQGRPALRDVLEALEVAASRPRIEALVAKVDAPAETWAHAQELHAAITAFRASGKPAIAHAQSFSEAGNAVLAYLVATAFDEIHLQPTGDVGVTGVASVQPFVADLLAKLDVVPQLEHRHEYKSAKDLFTERGLHRCPP